MPARRTARSSPPRSKGRPANPRRPSNGSAGTGTGSCSYRRTLRWSRSSPRRTSGCSARSWRSCAGSRLAPPSGAVGTGPAVDQELAEAGKDVLRRPHLEPVPAGLEGLLQDVPLLVEMAADVAPVKGDLEVDNEPGGRHPLPQRRQEVVEPVAPHGGDEDGPRVPR